jgi:hypothetical protein
MERYMGEEVVKNNRYYLQPFERIHLYSKQDYGFEYVSGDIMYVYLFGTVGVFILVVACINFHESGPGAFRRQSPRGGFAQGGRRISHANHAAIFG